MTYLDHNATTPLDERVLEAMLPFMRSSFGNPSGVYAHAREARQAIELAREQVATLVNAHPSQVVFTSGGTEANNLALKGAVLGGACNTIYYSAVEHPSIRDVARYIDAKQWAAAYALPVDERGVIDLASLQSVDKNNALVSVMWANNETGVINPVAEIASELVTRGVVFHTDAVQAAGKVEVDFKQSGAHLMSLSAHKIYGPKGVGALIVDKSLDLDPLLHGGGQEKGRRSGTENVAGIVGFGAAATLACGEMNDYRHHMMDLRQTLESGLKNIGGLQLFGAQVERIPNTTFFSVPGIDGEALLMQLDSIGFSVASGSACSSKTGKASHVLLSMGVAEEQARGAIRISLGKYNTVDEINAFVMSLSKLIRELRSFSVVTPV